MYSIDIETDKLFVRVLTRGATLAAVRLKPDPRNLVLGFADPLDHMNIPVYAGSVVGPVANRVSGGQVVINGVHYQMERNENGKTALHSGAAGLHAHDWSVVERSSSQVTLSTSLKDGEGGLPGNRRFQIFYQVIESALYVEISAATDHLTPINLAMHPYWALDSNDTIAFHDLQVEASDYTPTDGNNIPTGDVQKVDGTIFDFRSERKVPLDPQIDINFCLSPATRKEPKHACSLTGSDGTQVTLATNAPGLQVYNGAHLPELAGVLSDGRDLKPYGGLALEPQFWPDAPNKPSFPQILLGPHQKFRQINIYSLSRRIIDNLSP